MGNKTYSGNGKYIPDHIRITGMVDNITKKGKSYNDPCPDRIPTHGAKSKAVYKYTKDGKFLKKFESGQEAAADVKSTSTCISNCCNGKAKSVKGFVWSFLKGE